MRIRELRCAANMTQNKLASLVGVSQGIISNWETEVFLPKTRDLPMLAKALRCNIDDLFATVQEPADSA